MATITNFDTHQRMMSAEESLEVMELYKETGLEEYKDVLVKGNVGLVLSRLRKYKYDQDDLFQTGCIGLLKAIERFDVDRGNNFSTYAIYLIEGEIKRYLRDNGPFRIPRDHYRLQREFTMYKDKYPEKSKYEISDLMGISKGKLDDVLQSFSSSSLDEPIYEYEEGGQVFLKDTLDGGCFEKETVDNMFLFDRLNTLEQHLKEAIYYYYFKGLSQTETAKELGISQVAVSRRIRKARKKLKIKRRSYSMDEKKIIEKIKDGFNFSKKVMDEISKRERRILELYFIENVTVDKMVDELELSQGYISTIKKQTLKKIERLVKEEGGELKISINKVVQDLGLGYALLMIEDEDIKKLSEELDVTVKAIEEARKEVFETKDIIGDNLDDTLRKIELDEIEEMAPMLALHDSIAEEAIISRYQDLHSSEPQCECNCSENKGDHVILVVYKDNTMDYMTGKRKESVVRAKKVFEDDPEVEEVLLCQTI